MKNHLSFELNEDGRLALTIKTANHTDLIVAFSVALALHLLAFLLFHVDLAHFLTTTSPTPTLIVSADPSLPLVESELEEKLPIPPFLIVPPPPLPSLTLNQPHPFFDLSAYELDSKTARYLFSGGATLLNELKPLCTLKTCKAKLTFKIDNSGKIYWVNWHESTQDPKLDQEILGQLKTAKIASPSSSGIIEVEFIP